MVDKLLPPLGVKEKIQYAACYVVSRPGFGLVSQASPLVPQHCSLAVSTRGSSVWTSLSMYRWNVLTQHLHHQNCTHAYYAHMLMITASYLQLSTLPGV